MAAFNHDASAVKVSGQGGGFSGEAQKAHILLNIMTVTLPVVAFTRAWSPILFFFPTREDFKSRGLKVPHRWRLPR